MRSNELLETERNIVISLVCFRDHEDPCINCWETNFGNFLGFEDFTVQSPEAIERLNQIFNNE